jgi:hypothetical protein
MMWIGGVVAAGGPGVGETLLPCSAAGGPAGAAIVSASECRQSMAKCGWQAVKREAIDRHRCHAVMDVRVHEGKSAENYPAE